MHAGAQMSKKTRRPYRLAQTPITREWAATVDWEAAASVAEGVAAVEKALAKSALVEKEVAGLEREAGLAVVEARSEVEEVSLVVEAATEAEAKAEGATEVEVTEAETGAETEAETTAAESAGARVGLVELEAKVVEWVMVEDGEGDWEVVERAEASMAVVAWGEDSEGEDSEEEGEVPCLVGREAVKVAARAVAERAVAG